MAVDERQHSLAQPQFRSMEENPRRLVGRKVKVPSNLYRSPAPRFSWGDSGFNAAAHEVPSGPNPISNSGSNPCAAASNVVSVPNTALSFPAMIPNPAAIREEVVLSIEEEQLPKSMMVVGFW
nr:hypothetical protein Iba_chr06cCG7040 [Ipomoea batatas]